MGSKGSNTTTTNTAPNAQALSAYQDLLTRAGGVAQTPYQAYTGELVAPVNSQQYTGIGGVNQYANAAQPAISQALGQAASSSAPLNASTIQQYESPYTQQVVNATQAQFNNQNQQQQQQVVGNAIAQGALGGNRSAIAQSELANQQQLAQAPVIANLENQGYSQAVNTAMGEQGLGLQGASTLGNIGVAGQSAGLQGAQSQIGAGTLEQQTQQALDAANYGQYQAQQAYPYQQLSWLAGLDTGVGSQMGGTSSTTAPAPTLFQQLAGAGTAGVGLLGGTGAFGASGYLNPSSASWMFSSKKVKENIRHIGKANNGQSLYIFNYKGDPQKHIGFIAEDLEKKGKAHAVREINGIKAVNLDAATRANGGVVGYASGGTIPDTPWSSGVSYIPSQAMPSLGITHGRGAPSPPGVNNQGQQNLNQSVAQIGNMAKTLKDSMNGNNPLTSGPAWGGGSAAAGDAYGGSAAAPLPGLVGGTGPNSDYGPMARGGVAGFADGGSPDTDNTDVINPDEPYRMADPAAVEAWRNGTDNVNQPKIQPESQSSSDLPVSQGVAPSTMQYAASRKSDPSLPSEINTGSSAPTYSDGVAPSSSSGPDIDWSSNSKLWPALMSAGFGMMASRSPFAGVAIGEGGQAGLKTYGEEQQREFEAQKTAAELQRQADAERRAEEQQKISAMNQMIITGPNGKPMVNPDYIKAKQDIEREWQPKPIVIGTNTRGDPVQGYWDPNTKKAYDLSGHPVVTGPSGSIIPWGQEGNNGQAVPTPNNTNTMTPPIKSPAPVTAQNQPAPFSDRFNGLPSSPLNATAQAPVKVASIDPSFTPTPLSRVQQQAGYQTITQAEPHEADPRAPLGTEESRNTKFMADIAKQDPGYALALQKAANYELDPGKYASLQKGKREHFINDVLQYDPNYVPQEVGLRYRAQTAFLPGTKTGDTIGSFNTAISHLDVLKELYHNLNNPDMRVLAKIRNDWNTYWKGEAMPNTVAGIAQMVSGEVVKATVGAQNALGDREEAAKTVNRDLSTMQADDVIDKYERLMGGKLETARFQYHQSTGLKNFDDKFLLPRSQDVMKQVIAETGKHSSGHTEMTPQDHQALDWANSHPDDPRAAAIKKKLGQ